MYEYFLFEDFGTFLLESKQINNQQNVIGQTCPVIAIGHEFFDALPVHLFEYTEYGWAEKLVNICHDPTKKKAFEFFLSEPNSESV